MSTDSLKHKRLNAFRRSRRVRINAKGTSAKPRLSVYISSRNINAQIIDDQSGKTLVHVTTVGSQDGPNMSDMASWVGSEIAKKAIKLKVKNVIFDRGQHKYHGRVKKLAESARAGGLEF